MGKDWSHCPRLPCGTENSIISPLFSSSLIDFWPWLILKQKTFIFTLLLSNGILEVFYHTVDWLSVIMSHLLERIIEASRWEGIENGSVVFGGFEQSACCKKQKSIPNKSVSHSSYKCVYHTYLQRSICIFTHMSFQTWVVVLVGVWVTVAPISDDIYITSENGSNWGWIGCSPISDVSLICLFVRVYRHMARESLRITDSFTSLMSIDCPPKWFWTSFGQVFSDLHFLGQHFFKDTFAGKKYGFPNLWSIWGELPILIR